MTRTNTPQVLDRSPLVYVLAQVMFSSPVLAMPNYLADIHEALRGLGFNEVLESEEQEFQVTRDGIQSSRTRKRWDFLRADHRWGVVLTEQTVVLHTTQYEQFEAFLRLLLEVVEIVRTAARIEQVQRLGLRYTDRIRLTDDESAEAYVIPSMLGFPRECEANLGGTRLMSRTDTLLQTQAGALAIRCTEARGMALPPDLWPTTLELEALLPDERVLLLDFDHFTVAPMSADPSELGTVFRQLHAPVDTAFRTVTTEHAMECWGRRFLAE